MAHHPPNYKSRTKQGYFIPTNPHKYVGNVDEIVYRSSWEKRLMVVLDTNTNINKWGSETTFIPYFSQVKKKMAKYYPDFFIEQTNKEGLSEKVMIEVKPHKETVAPIKPKRATAKSQDRYLKEYLTFRTNTDKWESAKAFCKSHGWRFLIMDEYSLGLKKRGKWASQKIIRK